jgi:glycosyltransferase involved in cell wall biosynthesis
VTRALPRTNRPRSLLLEIKRNADRPWWWNDLDWNALGCELVHHPIVLERGRPAGLLSPGFLAMCLACWRALRLARREGYDYIYTVECDWTTIVIAGLQTLLLQRNPRHVILQFIMREKTPALISRLKYAFMRWCFASVHAFTCSSRAEASYYAEAFGLPPHRFAFVTLHTDSKFLALAGRPEEPFLLAAGRTFRDYPTLLDATRGLDVEVVIVAGRGSLEGRDIPSNVRLIYEMPLPELVDLMSRCMAVVLPLEDRRISIGQSVLFQAMAMGKPVVSTRVAGTEDYVEHGRTGLLVPPGDVAALREALRQVIADPGLRRNLGAAAREQVQRQHLPGHYARNVLRAVV